jgi:YbbR domain-containing protein
MFERVLANWPLKLLALGLAFAIWVSVAGERWILQDVQVPLDLELGHDVVVSTNAPTTVSVRLRGRESRMRRLDPVPIALRVDLTDATPGDQDLLLSPHDLVGVPSGVEVDFVRPDRLRLQLDRRLARDLPVEPTFLGRPASGYTVYGTEITPEVLSVEGPASQVADLEVLRTSPIRLDGRAAPFVARVGIVLDRPRVRVTDPRPLDVRVVVDARATERTLEDLPVEVSGAAGRVSVLPETLDVTLSGPPKLIEKLARSQVRPLADATGLVSRAGPRAVDVRVQFENIPAAERMRILVKSISRRTVMVSVE